MFVIKYRNILLAVGAILIVGSMAIVTTLSLNLGIDFTGGSLTEVVYDSRPDKNVLENEIDKLDLGGYSLREAADETGRLGYILRTRDLSEDERSSVEVVLTSGENTGEVTRYTSVGPVIGVELKDKAIKAIIAISIITILYVAFAFRGVSYPVGSWVYGGITILALVHDVLVPTAAMALMGHFMGVEVDVLFVMAILAVLGYSVNDTIVVFDRVRENLTHFRQEKKIKVRSEGGVQREEIKYILTKPFGEIVGLSVSQTLLRSLNTSATTLLSLCALYFFGGEVTATFALVLIVGVFAGTYSSICIANPLLAYFGDKKTEVKQ